MTPGWDPAFLERSPMFEPLRIRGKTLCTPHWPSLDDLQQALDQHEKPATNVNGMPIAFMPQDARPKGFEEGYEPRIYLRGEVQVRQRNWHDLLNALVWLTFPRAKAALNARHYQALLAQRSKRAPNRGPEQDAMTLFDEGGVIVAARERELLRLIESFEWKTLFWRNRTRVVADMRFYLFGHALYEKALNPFTGITARALFVEAGADFFQAPLREQLACLDGAMAGRLADPQAVRTPRDLPPLPILGVPGWCAGNADEAYYDNEDYFRKRNASASRR